MTGELATWLLTQIAEDEKVIRRACTYSSETFERGNGDSWSLRRDPDSPESTVQVWAACGALRPHHTGLTASVMTNHGTYLTWFDPKKTKADCDAKRRLVEQFQVAAALYDQADRNERDNATVWLSARVRLETWSAVLKELALSFADRPGYRPEWHPEHSGAPASRSPQGSLPTGACDEPRLPGGSLTPAPSSLTAAPGTPGWCAPSEVRYDSWD